MTGKQLKNSILQWAIQGCLVPQNPADELAAKLLERIREEKERLIKEKKIKRDKNATLIYRDGNSFYEKNSATGKAVCIDDEIPFQIPVGWEWVRLGEIVDTTIGKTPARGEQKYWADGVYNWISISDMSDGGVIYSTKEKLSDYASNVMPKISPKGSLIMSFKLTVGRTSILGIDAYHNEAIITIRPFVDDNHKMRNYLLKALPLLSVYGDSKDAIKGKTLNSKSIANLLLPLPPLPEQERIVSKIEELMPLVERYGAKNDELQKLNATISQKLRKSILQEAIQGRLVPQNPADEPAAKLLERIRHEKERLIKEKKIKRDKNATLIYRDGNSFYEKNSATGKAVCIDDEIPFQIPEGWEWVRLGEIFLHCSGKSLNNANKEGKLLTYITTSNLYWDRFELENLRSMYFKDSEIEKCTIRKGDLLVCEGGDVGRAAIWNEEYEMRIQNHIHKLRAYIDVCTKYFFYVFLYLKSAGFIGGKGIGIQGLSSGALSKIFLPLPPLSEQERIVSKIEEAFSRLG